MNIKEHFCFLIKLFQDLGQSQVYKSKYSYQIANFIKDRVLDSNLGKELSISKHQYHQRDAYRQTIVG
jgi:hypothetical protein